jgi:predicted ATPase
VRDVAQWAERLAAAEEGGAPTLVPFLASAPMRRIREGEGPALLFSEGQRSVHRAGVCLVRLGRSRILYRLLRAIASDGAALDRQALYVHVWQQQFRPPSSANALFVAVNRLRERLGDALSLEPTHEGGYRLLDEPAAFELGSGPAKSGVAVAARPSLPARVDLLVGRVEEIRRVHRYFAEGARLVSLVGPGGIGKTRLALESAAGMDAGWTCFVDAAGAQTEEALKRCVTLALDGGDGGVGAALRSRGHGLLVLDNLEQVVEAAAVLVARWLAEAADTRVLGTTRQALGIRGERVLELRPLPADEAIALFRDRAGLEEHESAEGIERVLAVLDGLPLALELAAARVRTLGLRQLGKRLERGLEPLGRSGPDRPDRHATLRATVAWSWDLLTAAERDALVQCTVFRGGFELEAAEAVVELSQHDSFPLDVVLSLRDRSLLARSGEERLDMLVMVRAFCDADGAYNGQRQSAEQRHAEWYADQARHFGQRADSDDEAHRWLAREEANIALSIRRGDAANAAVALLGADHIYKKALPALQHAELITSVLARQADEATRVRARLLRVRGAAWRRAEKLDGAIVDQEAALALISDQADPVLAGQIYGSLGVTHRYLGDLDAAERAQERCLALCRQVGDRMREVFALQNLGVVRYGRGDLEGARRRWLDALAQIDPAEPMSVASTLHSNLGALAIAEGRLLEAERHFASVERELDRRGIAHRGSLLRLQGTVVQLRGRLEDAAVLFRRAADRAGALGDRRVLSFALRDLAQVRLDQGEHEQAVSVCSEVLDMSFEGAGQRAIPAAAARRVLALIALDRGDRREAESLLSEERATTLPHKARSLVLADLAVCRLFEGDVDGALALLAEAASGLTSAGALAGRALVGVRLVGALIAAEAGDAATEATREAEALIGTANRLLGGALVAWSGAATPANQVIGFEARIGVRYWAERRHAP